MKVQYILSNIATAKEPVIAHGCNAQGVMGAGVAKALRNTFPKIYPKYRKAYDEGELNLGDVIWVDTEGKLFANCITQKYYGRDGSRYVSYNAVRACMYNINEKCKNLGITTLAMPMIGSSLGGGDWFEIKKIVEKVLTDVEPRVYLIDEHLMSELLEAQTKRSVYTIKKDYS